MLAKLNNKKVVQIVTVNSPMSILKGWIECYVNNKKVITKRFDSVEQKQQIILEMQKVIDSKGEVLWTL